MSGTVVDGDTDKPIEGAVVHVEWTKTKGIPGLTYGETYKIAETVTDKEGNFKILKFLMPPVNPPTVLVYKRGYVGWNNEYIFPNYARRKEMGNVIKMIKFKPDYTHYGHMYTHYAHVAFIENYSWEAGDKFKRAIEWEEKKARQEIDTKINLRLVCKVIDDESEEPIAEAIVLLLGRGIGYGRGTDEALEIVSDEKGKVIISGVFPMLVNPPHVNVYKKGYFFWDSHTLFPSNNFRKDFQWQDGYIFRLEKVTPEIFSYKNNLEIAKRFASDANKKGKTKLWNAIEQDTKKAEQGNPKKQ
jgi:hypothetical protein